MRSHARLTLGLVLVLLALAVLPGITLAQDGAQNASNRPKVTQEINTVIVDVVAPTNVRVMGTLVTRRTGGAEASTVWSFTGTVNGVREDASGNATELWPDHDVVNIVSLGTHSVHRWPTLLTKSGQIRQPNARLIEVVANGLRLPLAINGRIHRADLGGQTSYVVTNAGGGSKTVRQLPGGFIEPLDDKAPDLRRPPTVADPLRPHSRLQEE